MAKELIIAGAGGFGRETAWLVERINKKKLTWEIIGFVDDDDKLTGAKINGYPVVGSIDMIKAYPDAYVVCAIGSAVTRKKAVDRIEQLQPRIKFATLIDPDVVMSDLVSVGAGSIICAHTVITVNIELGKHVIINLDCTVGHDAVIGDFVTLYPSVNISGAADIGYCSELGTGTQIINGKKVGNYSIVGAGAVIVQDIPEKCTAVGCPAKPIRFFE